jgi:hypothetical protein
LVTVRGLFDRVMSRGPVRKTENGYGRASRSNASTGDDNVDDHECVFGDTCPYRDPDDGYIDGP